MDSLSEIIKEDIYINGPMTFDRFMELALYHPQYGYYTSTRIKIGRSGDYYTAPTVNPLFGAMLAKQFYEMWLGDDRPATWVLVEYGPGTGVLARDVANAIYQNYPEFYEALHYYLIEISTSLRESQQKLLSHSTPIENKFKWVNSLSEVKDSGINGGCVFANELVDAFPVHLVQKNNNGLQELYVTFDKGNFLLVEGALSSIKLEEYFHIQKVELELGQKAEVNLQAQRWLAEVARHLKRGFLLNIDYGATSVEMYAPHRFNGTLRYFYKHQLKDNPFINIGYQDITAHVNFSVISIWGEQLGLQKIGLVTQPKFLLNLGILDTLKGQDEFTNSPEVLKKTMAIKQLILPGGMGDIFKVLVQCKGYAQLPELSGFKKMALDQFH